MAKIRKTRRRSIISVIILVCLAAGIRLYASMPAAVELFYSTGVYPYIGSFLRRVFGSLPFSAGDILYALLFLYALWKAVQSVRNMRQQPVGARSSKTGWLRLLRLLLLLYIIFNVLWGLNYNRQGVHSQMGFERENYSKDDVIYINELLVEEVNNSKAALMSGSTACLSAKALPERTGNVFAQAAQKYPFLRYAYPSVKPSLFNVLGNYFGFSGYYNPFTGEAQVNTDIPLFLQPYVYCHEIAHQLGYARENEANFAGYIAATASGDPLFVYAAYFDIFLYANRNLYRMDSVAAKHFLTLLHPAVKADIDTLKAYYSKYENPVEPLFRWVYGKYLEVNDQPLGMMTYSEVVADVIAWQKNTGSRADRKLPYRLC